MDEIKLIKEYVDAIKKLGHGEIRILIKNGIIYRILATEDKLIAP